LFLHNLIVFTRLLRRSGFDMPVGTVQDLTTALTHVNLQSREEVFHACRALIVRRHDQIALFAQLFDAFWRDHANPFEGRSTKSARDTLNAGSSTVASIAAPDEDGRDTEDVVAGAVRAWSGDEVLRHKDFGEFTAGEVTKAREVIDRMSWVPGEHRTRRWERGRGPRLDMSRALRRGLRTGGDIITLPTRRRRVRPRPLVLLCDVSGSMERYTRMLLHFAHGMAQTGNTFEAFLFSTSLTRVTRQIRLRRMDAAVRAVSEAVPDWSGGTRIGAAVETFHKRWSRRVLRRSPVVLIVSDGWDRGDPEVLRDQIARLQRSCHRLVWLNPLIGTPDYSPLTRGLQAALPFVDDFLPARTLTDLKDLALHLSALGS
jgi:uncharacterized protein with von Willebrand factor type A (vWA) domain